MNLGISNGFGAVSGLLFHVARGFADNFFIGVDLERFGVPGSHERRLHSGLPRPKEQERT